MPVINRLQYNKKNKIWMLYYNGRKKIDEQIGLATYKQKIKYLI